MAEQKESKDDGTSADDFVQIFLMNITISKANGLMKADVFGKSDPYCIVNALGQTYTTKTIMKTLDPVWNESTQICTFEDPKELKFEIFDWDKGTQDDPIGHAMLSLNGFFNDGNNGFSGDLELTGGKKVKGTVTVTVKCRKLLPVKLENDGKRLKQETDQQSDDIITTTNDIKRLKDRNNDLESKNADLFELIQELKGGINAKTDEIKEFETKNSELTTEIDTLNGDKKTKDDELTKIKNEYNDVLTIFNKTQNESDKLKNELENLKIQKINLQKDIDDKKKAANKPKSNVDETKKEESGAGSEQPLVDGQTNNKLTDVPDKQKCCCIVL